MGAYEQSIRPVAEKEVVEVKKIIVLLMVSVVALAATAALAGCGSSQTTNANLADDVQMLRSNMTDLVDPSTYKSFDNFEAAWKKIESSYNHVIADAKNVKGNEVANVKSSFTDLKKAIGDVTSSASLQPKVSGILTAGEKFLAALGQLNDALTPTK